MLLVMPPYPHPLTRLTIDAVQADAIGLVARDGMALDHTQEWQLRIWSLQNEVDQVQARARIADQDPAPLVMGLIRVAARALLWVETLEGGQQAAERLVAGQPDPDLTGGTAQP